VSLRARRQALPNAAGWDSPPYRIFNLHFSFPIFNCIPARLPLPLTLFFCYTPPMFPAQSRRDFLKSATLAATALALAKARSWAATGLDPAQAPAKYSSLVPAWRAWLPRGTQARRPPGNVLEATLRPGGRVRTLRQPFSDGLYAEAGAGRIP